MTASIDGRCMNCKQPRPLFAFSWVPAGFVEFREAKLCARCWSDATVEEEQAALDYDVFGQVAA